MKHIKKIPLLLLLIGWIGIIAGYANTTTSIYNLNKKTSCGFTLSVTPDTAVICMDSTVVLTASPGGRRYSYLWTPATGLSSTSSSTVSASPSQTTTYTVFCTDIFTGCTDSTTVTVIVDTTCGGPPRLMNPNSNNMHSNIKLSVYPSPANTYLHIDLSPQGKGGRFFLYNTEGQLIKSIKLNSTTNTLDIHSLSTGVYYYRFKTTKGELLKSGNLTVTH